MPSSTAIKMEDNNMPPEVTAQKDAPTLEALMVELRAVVLAGQDGKSSGSTPRYQNRLLCACLAAMLCAWVTAVAAERGAPVWVSYLSLGALVFGALAAVGSGVSSAKGFLQEWKTVEVDMLEGVSKRMSVWYGTISTIRKTYTTDQIHFAQDYVTAVSSQLRSRLACFVGALDKVGVIPVVASASVALIKFHQDGVPSFIWLTATSIAVFFYVLALRFLDVAFTLERLAVILKHAAIQPEMAKTST